MQTATHDKPRIIIKDTASILIDAAKDAYHSDRKDIPEWITQIQGMSGQKYRQFINTVVSNTPNARYLEIGSWQGSTCCSAIVNNEVHALCIDNWSLFNPEGTIKQSYTNNVTRAIDDRAKVNIIESDFRLVDYSIIGSHNVYLFDGPHEEYNQYTGIVIAQPALDDEYILIVDDWNWACVRNGTHTALKFLNSIILYSIEIRTSLDESQPDVHGDYSDWHNGYYIAVVKKFSGL
ncbi:hypothetical protein UFOVP49_47 [uncultured Caudovirales phage]|uniref:Methyltransferase domain containing protein n=1 Tax=uncultured Caudovirales phage TaxID=2100421 RepID=A0A6J5KQK7_9CAUD|nr:hypothetical protein UFOVP49_47 [uncultured Caudovirales phage]